MVDNIKTLGPHQTLNPRAVRFAMVFETFEPSRGTCVAFACEGIPRHVLRRLQKEGVEFSACSKGAVKEYDDKGILMCLVECMHVAAAIDRYQFWKGQGKGAYAKAIERLSIAILRDRSRETSRAFPGSWQEIEDKALANA